MIIEKSNRSLDYATTLAIPRVIARIAGKIAAMSENDFIATAEFRIAVPEQAEFTLFTATIAFESDESV